MFLVESLFTQSYCTVPENILPLPKRDKQKFLRDRGISNATFVKKENMRLNWNFQIGVFVVGGGGGGWVSNQHFYGRGSDIFWDNTFSLWHNQRRMLCYITFCLPNIHWRMLTAVLMYVTVHDYEQLLLVELEVPQNSFQHIPRLLAELKKILYMGFREPWTPWTELF